MVRSSPFLKILIKIFFFKYFFPGFRDKDMSAGNRHRLSSESLNTKSHSRNPSDGSGYSQHGVPPSGTRRVPDGQEKTPSPNGPQRIPHEVWDRFEGKSREVCICI